MLRSSIPPRFLLAWAANAAGAFIRTVPVASQIGIVDGAASYNDGFVPDNFTALAGGGVPPFGQDFNGAMNEMTTWDQWYQAGAYIPYDATYAAAIGGYPKSAILDSAVLDGAQWYSTVDANSTNPDDPLTSTNWGRVGVPAGTPLPFFSAEMPPGFVAMSQLNNLTIGSAASGSSYQSSNALFLFAHNWLSFPNTQCPILTSAGAPSTRGANAVADFLANKRLTMPDGRGSTFVGADAGGSTFLTGVPITFGGPAIPGSILGENLHQLTAQQNGPHAHANAPADSGHVHANAPADSGHVHANAPADSGHAHAATTINGAQVLTNAGGALGFGTGSRNQVAIDQAFSINNSIANIVANNASATANITANNASSTANIVANNAPSGSGLGHNTVSLCMTVFWGQKL